MITYNNLPSHFIESNAKIEIENFEELCKKSNIGIFNPTENKFNLPFSELFYNGERSGKLRKCNKPILLSSIDFTERESYIGIFLGTKSVIYYTWKKNYIWKKSNVSFEKFLYTYDISSDIAYFNRTLNNKFSNKNTCNFHDSHPNFNLNNTYFTSSENGYRMQYLEDFVYIASPVSYNKTFQNAAEKIIIPNQY